MYRTLSSTLVVFLLATACYAASAASKDAANRSAQVRYTLEAQPPKGHVFTQAAQQAELRALKHRAKVWGISPDGVTFAGSRRFEVVLPDDANTATLAKHLAATNRLEFRYLKEVQSVRNPHAKYAMSVEPDADGVPGYAFFNSKSGKKVPVGIILSRSPLILTGNDLRDNAEVDLQGGYRPVVSIAFAPKGQETFAQFTRTHVGTLLAIVLDGRVLTAPKVDEPILNGDAVISGGFKSVGDAQSLARSLNGRALPVPLAIVKKEVVQQP